jgi:ketosteroid isomerase-like protein
LFKLQLFAFFVFGRENCLPLLTLVGIRRTDHQFHAKRGKLMAEQSPDQLINAWEAAAKNKDATTLEGFYTDTPTAVLCATEGIITGKSQILGDFSTQFTAGWVLSGITTKGTNEKNDMAWAYGTWNGTFPNPNPKNPPHDNLLQLQGCWSLLMFNQPSSNNQANWLIAQQTIVTDPVYPDPLAPPPSS